MFEVANTKKSALPVTAVEVSGNSKTGPLSATYAAQITCPDSCPHKGSSCYAESGLTGFTTRRVNRNAQGLESDQVFLAKLEAELIDQLKALRPLRVHVVGDCSTDETARIVGAAMRRYSARGNQVSYTYTHAWRDVSRVSWNGASVLASCETIDDIRAARARGYASTIVVEKHPENGKAYFKEGELFIPCPAQVRDDITCNKCKLCFDAQKLFDRKATIAFAPEGNTGKKMRVALKVV